MSPHAVLACLLAAVTCGGACATSPAAPPPPAPLRAASPTRALVRHPGPAHGEPAPPLSGVRWLRGRAPAPGQPYLLFFWGTWCKPCKAVLPQVMAYAAARELPIVAISRDSAAQLERFLASWAAPFPARVAYEHPDYPLHLAYDAFSVPRLVEVAADGTIAMVHYGVVDLARLGSAPGPRDGASASPP